MDDTRLGSLFRAVRIHLRLRQEDLASRAGVSQASVSRIERGHFATQPLASLRAIAQVLEIRVALVPAWRGGDLERVMSVRHSALHEVLAGRMASIPGWESAAEVTYSIYGERGVIDRLGFHQERQMLAVFEIKTDLSDPAGLVAQVDRYRRLAPDVARDRGWEADPIRRLSRVRPVSCWAVVADTDTNRRRLAAHRELIRGPFPADGRDFAEWLRDPVEPVNGLVFLAYPRRETDTRSLSTIKRVRLSSRA